MLKKILFISMVLNVLCLNAMDEDMHAILVENKSSERIRVQSLHGINFYLGPRAVEVIEMHWHNNNERLWIVVDRIKRADLSIDEKTNKITIHQIMGKWFMRKHP